MQYPDDVEWIDITGVGDTHQRQVSLCGRFKRYRELIPGLPHRHFEAELPWTDGTPNQQVLDHVPPSEGQPVLHPLPSQGSDSDFKELCIAVAQLAHSCQKLGLTGVKLQISPRDYSVLAAHSLACGEDLHGLHKTMHLTHEERNIATIPLVVKW